MARFQRKFKRPEKSAAPEMDVPKMVRQNSISSLAKMGYRVSPALPLEIDPNLTFDYSRAAYRLLALKLVFAYVAAPPDQVPSELIQGAIRENKLTPYFSQGDRAMLQMDRAQSRQQNLDAVGWRLENMVALAAIFGSTIMKDIGPTMCSGDNVSHLINHDCPPFQGSANRWAHEHTKLDVPIVQMLEDFFYCWHNAARSIVYSGAPNPTQHDPRVLCRIIHERRHSLSWAVRGGDWDATDLST